MLNNLPLTWFDDQPRVTDDGLRYFMWFLVEDSGRVLATVDGPTSASLCYSAVVEGRQDRLYVHLAGAKEWCEKKARELLTDELKQRALKRRESRSRSTKHTV
jgi:hypothetical protein